MFTEVRIWFGECMEVNGNEGYVHGYCLWQWVLYDGPFMTIIAYNRPLMAMGAIRWTTHDSRHHTWQQTRQTQQAYRRIW